MFFTLEFFENEQRKAAKGLLRAAFLFSAFR
jgi:hypothetical protein